MLIGLQRISADMQQLNSDLPVSVDNMSFIADEFVVAADILPTLLVRSDDSEKPVCMRHYQRYIVEMILQE